MTDVATFLHELSERDVRITVKGDRLQLNAPEGAVTDQLRAEIAARKSEILAFVRNARQESASAFPLRHVPRDRPLPLSFAQQRLWFLHKLNPNDSVYNLGVSTTVLGDVDPKLVQRSAETLAERHEVLRTTFHETDGVPTQRVTSVLPTVHIVDFTHASEDTKREDVTTFIEQDIRQPFALSSKPPVRITLIRIAPDVSVLYIAIHHIIADGWSLGLLVQQFNEIYDKLRGGQPKLSPTLSWQYADYAYSEQQWFAQDDQQPHIEYWKRKLGSSPPSLDLPTDHSPGRVLGSRGATQTFTLSPQLAQSLRTLSQRNGVTLFTTLLAIFKTMLSRYSGQSDIVVGTPIANRKHTELEPLIGLFVSTIVLRTDLSGNPTFQDLMRRVHDNVLDAHEHQDYPFEKLVDLLRPDRNLARSPLFQTAFILQNTPRSRSYETTGGGSTFELSLYLWDGGEDIPGSFEYNADLFEASTIARMVGHFLTLAEVVVNDAARRLSDLPMLTTPEWIQVSETWNNTTTEYPRDQSVITLFEEQAGATPDARALVVPAYDARPALELTYRELDAHAERFSERLRDVGVSPGSRVGLVAGRSAEFVVAVLAILKCGAVYVPIDPTLPADRLTTMLADADVAAILVQGDVSSFPNVDVRETPVVQLDDVVQKLVTATGESNVSSNLGFSDVSRVPGAQTGILRNASSHVGQPQSSAFHSSLEPTATISAESPAYVMYTSGSTGIPKGVVIPHRAIVRLVRNTNYITLTNSDRILACAPVSFDASTLEIWGSLLNGGTLVLYPSPIPEPVEIGRLVREHQITTLWLTAGLFHVMAETHPEGFRGVRQLLAGGDVLSPVHVRTALRILDGGALINGYGPTENTTFTCCYRMTDPDDVPDNVPIGRPISNTRVYILDSNRRLAPVGVHGELWTGGDGLAIGYLNDPELTASRFVHNPFSKEPGARMYRTGDIARFRADGVIEFLGRVDNQVKIRGFRVELGEIEHVIAEHLPVTNAIVLARAAEGGHRRLVAYLVPKDLPISLAEVKRVLQQHLPDYAIPSAVVCLDTLPLTTNGKVDYAALPEPVIELRESHGPQNELEAQLIPIWEKVLGISNIGRTDNFFDIGGNSLLALQLLANVEKTIGRRVPATVLFESQTVESMALALSDGLEEVTTRAVPLQRGGTRPPVFIVPGVNGNVIGYEKLAQALGPDQPVYGLRSVGLDGERPPLDNIPDIAAQFVADIRQVQPAGPYHLIGFCMGGIVAYAVANRLLHEGDEVDTLVLVDTWPPRTIPASLGTSKFVQQVAFVVDAVKRQFRDLRAQPTGTRMKFIRRKFHVLYEIIQQRDVYRGEHAVLHGDLVSRANQYAASKHAPSVYPGNAHLFLLHDRALGSFKQDPRLSWTDLVQGECHVVAIDGPDSGALLRPPYVQGIADRVRGLLDISLTARVPVDDVMDEIKITA